MNWIRHFQGNNSNRNQEEIEERGPRPPTATLPKAIERRQAVPRSSVTTMPTRPCQKWILRLFLYVPDSSFRTSTKLSVLLRIRFMELQWNAERDKYDALECAAYYNEIRNDLDVPVSKLLVMCTLDKANIRIILISSPGKQVVVHLVFFRRLHCLVFIVMLYWIYLGKDSETSFMLSIHQID